MLYFFVIIVLLFLFIRYDWLRYQRGEQFCWYLMLLVFILISGLRYRIGSDTLIYMDEYDWLIPTVSELFSFDFSSTRYDFLWIVFCSICKSISPSYFFMQFVQAVIINCIYFYFISKSTNYRFTGLFLYFLFGFLYFNTEIMREAMAVGIFLLAIDSFYHKKWIKYYLYAFIAILFHSSALFILIFPFVAYIKINKFFFYSTLIVALFANVFWGFFYESIEYLSVFSNIGDKASSYLDNEAFVYNINGIILSLFTYSLIPLFFVFFAKRKGVIEIIEAPFLWIYVIVGVFVIFNNTIFTRFQNYLFFPFIVFLANFMNFQEKKFPFKTMKITVLLIFLFIGRYYNFFKLDTISATHHTTIYQRYFPYHSIITKKTIPGR